MNGPDGWCGQQTAVPEGTLDSRRVFEGVFHSRKGKGKAGQIFLAAQPTAGITFSLERRSFQVKRLNIWSNLKMPRKVKITYAHQLTGQILLSRTLAIREKWHIWHPSINSLDCILSFAAVVFTVQLHLLWHDFLSPPPAARSQQWRKAVDGQLRVDNDGHWTVASPPVTTSVKVNVGLHGVCAFL